MIHPQDLDPPAVTQPSQPPPPVSIETPASPSSSEPSKRRIMAALAGLAAVTVGYVALHAHGEGGEEVVAAAHVTAAHVSRPADLLARIDQAMANLPREAADVACAETAEALPLVAYASAEARSARSGGSAMTEDESLVFSGATPLAEIPRLQTAQRVAVLRTHELTEPKSSVGVATPGRYEGRLVVIDTATGAPLCHSRVVAWSSTVADQPGLADRTLREDFVGRVRAALAESSARLHVAIDL